MSLFDELNSLDDLNGLIERKIRESDILEYKTAGDKAQDQDKDRAGRALAAFANSSGGVLIYGVETKDPKDPDRPTQVVGVSDWSSSYLQKHARDGVRNPIPGVRVKTIPFEPGRQVLLFDVPASPVAPHQLAADNVYYRREGAHSKPMTHDLVELFFGRRLQAVLEPVPSISHMSEPGELRKARVLIAIRNTGGQIGRDVLTRIIAPDPNRVLEIERTATHISLARGVSVGKEGGLAYEHIGELYYPGLEKNFIEFWITTRKEAVGRDHVLLYFDSYAADSRPQRYELFLTFGGSGWELRAAPAGVPSGRAD